MRKFLIILVSSFPLTACGQTQNTKQTTNKKSKKMQDETLLKPVKTLMEAMQTENAELIRAQFSETATQAYDSDGVMKTAEETKKWIESDLVNSQGKDANPEYSVISENVVFFKWTYSLVGSTNKANLLFNVQ